VPAPATLKPHIAGTYFTALQYAFPGHEWDRVKDRDQTCQAILRDGYALESNPLSHVALTNFYKWVTIGRRNKGGGQDRKHVDRDLETALFLQEVRLLAPHVVVFQGAAFDKARFRQVRESIAPEVEWHVLVHPSWRRSQRPEHITQPRLSSMDSSDDALPSPPAIADREVPQPAEAEGYRGLFRDDALLLGLIALDGHRRDVRLHDVVTHVLEHGYAGQRGGKGSAIYLACRWLAKHGKPVRGFVITSPRRGYYRLENATKLQIAAWSTDMGGS